MNVAFISPAYPPEQQDFTRGLHEVGARVIGVGDGHEGALPEKVRRSLSHYLRIPQLFDEAAAAPAIAAALRPFRPERVESNWEPTVLLAARVRDQLGVVGMSYDTCLGFRDKETMKQRLRLGPDSEAAGAPQLPNPDRVGGPRGRPRDRLSGDHQAHLRRRLGRHLSLPHRS